MKKHTLHKLFYAAMIVMAGSISANGQGIITTIAGTGASSFSGDGGLATAATFSSPMGVAVDHAGNIYIADKMNSRVRKIEVGTGLVSTFAGSSFGNASSGLGGPASAEHFEYPDGVFVNASGDVLVTDWFSDMTVVIDHTTGNVASRCGCGSQGNTGDGGACGLARMMVPTGACEDIYGNSYMADNGSNKIRYVNGATGIVNTLVNGTGTYGYTGDGGLALNATTSQLSGVFFDPTSTGNGTLYISDAGNNVIRAIDLNTHIITTIAGTGAAGYAGNGGPAIAAKLSNPGNLCIDASKNLYICDRGNNVIRKVNLLTGIISTVAGNGTSGFSGDGALSTSAQLRDPEGVWVDNSGTLYIADAGNNRIRKVNQAAINVAGGTVRASTMGSSATVSTTATHSSAGSTTRPKGLPVIASSVQSDEVSIYPNPSNGIFTILVGSDYANASVSVLNVTGQQVFSTVLSGPQNEINLGNQPAGIYTIVMRSQSGIHTEKLTIE